MTKQFTFYWLDGKRNVLNGDNPANALTLAGYSNGAVRALDFWAEGDNQEYEWRDRRWQARQVEVES